MSENIETKGKSKYLSFLICFLSGALLIGAVFLFAAIISKGKPKAGDNNVCIGDVSLEGYTIVAKSGTSKEARRLSDHIYKSIGKRLKISRKAGEHNIFLSHKTESDVFLSENGDIYILSEGKGLGKLVDVFANTYLGISFAGTEREKVTSGKTMRYDTDISFIESGAWIPEREPCICLWSTTMPRGAYYNYKTDPICEIMSYSDQELYDYVRMMKFMGFTGIQVTDICAAWAAAGGVAPVHARIRYMADAAHSLGMKFTLWVWGSEFSAYGWEDESVKYYGETIFDTRIPEVLGSYYKYYGYYKELADCSDRLIVHFFDPGHVYTMENAAFFLSLLKDYVRSVNPDIKIGVDLFGDYYDIPEFLELTVPDDTHDRDGFTYYTLSASDCKDYAAKRQLFNDYDAEYSVWSWGVTEREIDQTAMMNVNAKILKEVYQNTRQYDGLGSIPYWSEMDSYHLANIFSLYAAGKLLIDPDRDSDVVLMESAAALVGHRYAEYLFRVLKTIELGRSGKDYAQFMESEDTYLLSPDYPWEELIPRCEDAINVIDELVALNDLTPLIPLPKDAADILCIIYPHIKQIRDYAVFRRNFAKVQELADSGAGIDELNKALKESYVHIDSYDTITGLWGQMEMRAENLLIEAFCERYGTEPVSDRVLDAERKGRIIAEFISWQRSEKEKVLFDKETGFQYGVAFGPKTTRRLTEELVEEGRLTEDPSGKVYLTDWEEY